MEEVFIIAFYHFENIDDVEEMRERVFSYCKTHDILGTMLIAHEGINGTMSCVKDPKILTGFLESLFSDIVYKIHTHTSHPFEKLKVKIKNEIVAMGVENIDVNRDKGEYIEPQDWNKILDDENYIVIDTRNKYEWMWGTFEGCNVELPETVTFREFEKWVQCNEHKLKGKEIAMFCTGGVRCEKSTSLLQKMGYKAKHLKGGILQYLDDIKGEVSKWKGNCFVFDNRVSVNADLKASDNLCPKCNKVLTAEEIKYGIGFGRSNCNGEYCK